MPAPALIVWGATALVAVAKKWGPTIVKQVALALGIYLFVAEPGTDLLVSLFTEKLNLLTGTAREVLMYCNIDDFVAMVSSAAAIRAASRISLRAKDGVAKAGKPT